MFRIETSNKFEKDFSKLLRRNYDADLLDDVLKLLESNGRLPSKYTPHKLSGNYKNYWECHIKPDWLLIWKQDNVDKIIVLVRTGTHADLFK